MEKIIFGEGLPLPQPNRIVYQKTLNTDWDEQLYHGIQNVGNICYMNSVIQCLQYVPIWSNYLWHEHRKECEVETEKCFACLLSVLTKTANKYKAKVIPPLVLAEKLTTISKHLIHGRQHDAHEFLTCFFERMQDSLAPKPVDPYVEMTTAVGKIFGGFLRSQITCQECFLTSNKYEPYFNISLDIDNIDNMESALNKFFEVDIMDDNPWYGCERCEKHTRAAKRYTIETLPEVLIFQLKRYDMFCRKLSHKVNYPEILNLDSYLSSTEKGKKYKLYGMVSHIGRHLQAGHYRAFVSHPASEEFDWHCIDDTSISNVTWPQVASNEAYLLFYIKRDTKCEVMEQISHEENSSQIRQSESVFSRLNGFFKTCKNMASEVFS